MRYLFLTLVSLVFAVPAVAQPLPAQKSDFHLFLLIGQSNMAGRGKVSVDDKRPIPRVLMLDKNNRWVPAVDPMHFDKPVAGVGLGRSFAEVIAAANPEVTVGLIPCAVGGSPIASWEPGGYHKQTKTHPYDDMLPRLHIALRRGTLKAILWHQGESDSTAELAPLYETRLTKLITRLRSEVGEPEMPFIAGQMGRFPEQPWNEHRVAVDAVHRLLPAKVKKTAYVHSEGLTHKGDKVHFAAASYRQLGRRYAKAFQDLTK